VAREGVGRSQCRFGNRSVPRFRLARAPQQKTTRRGGGALLGLLQGGEICISIYVDPWEVGGPLMCRGRVIVGSDGRHMGDAEPNQEVFSFCPLSVVLSESLNSVRTYVRFVCEWDHRPRPAPGSPVVLGYPVEAHGTSSSQSVVKNLYRPSANGRSAWAPVAFGG